MINKETLQKCLTSAKNILDKIKYIKKCIPISSIRDLSDYNNVDSFIIDTDEISNIEKGKYAQKQYPYITKIVDEDTNNKKIKLMQKSGDLSSKLQDMHIPEIVANGNAEDHILLPFHNNNNDKLANFALIVHYKKGQHPKSLGTLANENDPNLFIYFINTSMDFNDIVWFNIPKDMNSSQPNINKTNNTRVRFFATIPDVINRYDYCVYAQYYNDFGDGFVKENVIDTICIECSSLMNATYSVDVPTGQEFDESVLGTSAFNMSLIGMHGKTGATTIITNKSSSNTDYSAKTYIGNAKRDIPFSNYREDSFINWGGETVSNPLSYRHIYINYYNSYILFLGDDPIEWGRSFSDERTSKIDIDDVDNTDKHYANIVSKLTKNNDNKTSYIYKLQLNDDMPLAFLKIYDGQIFYCSEIEGEEDIYPTTIREYYCHPREIVMRREWLNNNFSLIEHSLGEDYANTFGFAFKNIYALSLNKLVIEIRNNNNQSEDYLENTLLEFDYNLYKKNKDCLFLSYNGSNKKGNTLTYGPFNITFDDCGLNGIRLIIKKAVSNMDPTTILVDRFNRNEYSTNSILQCKVTVYEKGNIKPDINKGLNLLKKHDYCMINYDKNEPYLKLAQLPDNGRNNAGEPNKILFFNDEFITKCRIDIWKDDIHKSSYGNTLFDKKTYDVLSLPFIKIISTKQLKIQNKIVAYKLIQNTKTDQYYLISSDTEKVLPLFNNEVTTTNSLEINDFDFLYENNIYYVIFIGNKLSIPDLNSNHISISYSNSLDELKKMQSFLAIPFIGYIQIAHNLLLNNSLIDYCLSTNYKPNTISHNPFTGIFNYKFSSILCSKASSDNLPAKIMIGGMSSYALAKYDYNKNRKINDAMNLSLSSEDVLKHFYKINKEPYRFILKFSSFSELTSTFESDTYSDFYNKWKDGTQKDEILVKSNTVKDLTFMLYKYAYDIIKLDYRNNHVIAYCKDILSGGITVQHVDNDSFLEPIYISSTNSIEPVNDKVVHISMKNIAVTNLYQFIKDDFIEYSTMYHLDVIDAIYIPEELDGPIFLALTRNRCDGAYIIRTISFRDSNSINQTNYTTEQGCSNIYADHLSSGITLGYGITPIGFISSNNFLYYDDSSELTNCSVVRQHNTNHMMINDGEVNRYVFKNQRFASSGRLHKNDLVACDKNLCIADINPETNKLIRFNSKISNLPIVNSYYINISDNELEYAFNKYRLYNLFHSLNISQNNTLNTFKITYYTLSGNYESHVFKIF